LESGAMRTLVIFVILTCFGVASADFYKVTVKRVDQDLYQVVGTNFYIQTQYCYHYTYGEEAILNYDQYSYSNKLIFNSGTHCNVLKVF
jgi:hypothetical protein